MQISFLIVTRNRPKELEFTLQKLKAMIDLSVHEVLVFIDDCFKTEALISKFIWVKWTVSKENISASPARNALYKKAQGKIFIGLDDDAHPISNNFIEAVETEFKKNEFLGIIAFQEVRGIYETDAIALGNAFNKESYKTNDFVGCGFAIKKDVYNATNGFPLWINIYGEEPALALEVLNLNFDILYKNSIIINHRVDVEKRKVQGRGYFRFKNQLKNEIAYFIVYYPKPTHKIIKLLVHNFRKYAIKDFNYMKAFFKVCFSVLINLRTFLKFRNPVKKETIQKKIALQQLKY